jgi:hypothetical protein
LPGEGHGDGQPDITQPDDRELSTVRHVEHTPDMRRPAMCLLRPWPGSQWTRPGSTGYILASGAGTQSDPRSPQQQKRPVARTIE